MEARNSAWNIKTKSTKWQLWWKFHLSTHCTVYRQYSTEEDTLEITATTSVWRHTGQYCCLKHCKSKLQINYTQIILWTTFMSNASESASVNHVNLLPTLLLLLTQSHFWCSTVSSGCRHSDLSLTNSFATSSPVRCESIRSTVHPVSSRRMHLARGHQHAQLPRSATSRSCRTATPIRRSSRAKQ